MRQAALGLVLTALAWQVQGFAADFSSVVEQRQDLMKANRAAQKELKSAASAGDLATIEAEANKLAGQFEKIGDPALFPPGSDTDKSRARTLIWENRNAFEAQVNKAVAIAKAIAEEAKAGQLQQARDSIDSLGKNTCTNCHITYRKPREIK